MKNPQQLAQTIEASFEQIHQENMRDIPILNPAIRVEALGFQCWGERVLGIIITPWMMNLVLLPADDEDWSEMQLGDKRPHEFPSGSYKFMANDIDGIGPCMTHSLYSPMREFASHEQALQVAQDFVEGLFEAPDADAPDPVDEELLGRIMRGEETADTDFDRLAEDSAPSFGSVPDHGNENDRLSLEKNISRRSLLRGNLGEALNK